MSVQIVSGASGDLLTIDPTSKAARVTLYDSAGNETNPPPTGGYTLPVNIRQTATTAAASSVWAFRAGTNQRVYVRRVKLVVVFDGTAATATQRYELIRFSGGNPSAGTTITPVKRRSSYASSDIATTGVAQFLDTGLTMSGVSFETSIAVLGAPISVTSSISLWSLDLETPGQKFGCIELATQEGLAIRLITNAAVVGQGIYGYVEVDERTT